MKMKLKIIRHNRFQAFSAEYLCEFCQSKFTAPEYQGRHHHFDCKGIVHAACCYNCGPCSYMKGGVNDYGHKNS